jgi:hypothetical protein
MRTSDGATISRTTNAQHLRPEEETNRESKDQSGQIPKYSFPAIPTLAHLALATG